MWKKRLIAFITFIAGLYFVLEFFLPTTVSWTRVTGTVVQAPSNSQIIVRSGSGNQTIDLKPGIKVYRIKGKANELIETADVAAKLKVGDKVMSGRTTYITDQLTNVNNFLLVVGAMAWGMGLFSLWLVHSSNIRKRRPEWPLSVILFGAIFLGLLAGYGRAGQGSNLVQNIGTFTVYQFINPMGATIFSMLTFYMASAAYRTFKAKTGEAILMMVSAMIVMLGQIPAGMWISGWLQDTSFSWLMIPNISQWILNNINSAAVKGMWFGMMLGAIAVGLRFWLSLERGAFFDREL